MRRPRWTWRGYLPRPPDDGRCAVWGGACERESPRVWSAPLCPAHPRRCHRSGVDRADYARRMLRGLARAFGVVIVAEGGGTGP